LSIRSSNSGTFTIGQLKESRFGSNIKNSKIILDTDKDVNLDIEKVKESQNIKFNKSDPPIKNENK